MNKEQAPQSTTSVAVSAIPVFWERVLVACVVLMCLPVMLANTFAALVRREPLVRRENKLDALGRPVCLHAFSRGYIKGCAVLLQVLHGQMRLVGATCSFRLELQQPGGERLKLLPTGVISLQDLYRKSGLAITSPQALYLEQCDMTVWQELRLVLRYGFNTVFYQRETNPVPALLPMFGLSINNTSMDKAIAWVTQGTFFRGLKRSSLALQRPAISFFVNANSINLAQRNPDFKSTLKKADCLFADGSGMRLAAQSKHLALQDNINGTDMLPLLCRVMEVQGKRLFLLGARPGVAEKMALNLKQKWPGLQVVGIQHGYFRKDQEPQVVADINNSQADILLVAQGSPLQESWVVEMAPKLHCSSVLAVGGLFDFYSGDIPRSPLWMRETGLEWIWRLAQEPVTKFKRYVVGVPEFLIRTFVLRQVIQE